MGDWQRVSDHAGKRREAISTPAQSTSDDLVVVVVVDVGGVLNGVRDRERNRGSRDPDGVVERLGSNGSGVSSRLVLERPIDCSPRDHSAADACLSFGAQAIGNRT